MFCCKCLFYLADGASASAHRNYQQGRQNNFSLAFGAVVVSVSVSVFINVMDGWWWQLRCQEVGGKKHPVCYEVIKAWQQSVFCRVGVRPRPSQIINSGFLKVYIYLKAPFSENINGHADEDIIADWHVIYWIQKPKTIASHHLCYESIQWEVLPCKFSLPQSPSSWVIHDLIFISIINIWR